MSKSEPVIKPVSKLGPFLSHKSVPQTDSVIVLGAGPSLTSNLQQILDYKKEHNSIVVAASRNYPVFAEYTLFVDHVHYQKQIGSIRSPNIIMTSWCQDSVGTEKNDFNFLVVKALSRPEVYYVDKLEMNKKGTFVHGLGNSGLTTIVSSVFFRPKHVLLAGLDGPDGTYGYSVKFDGTRSGYNKKKQKRLRTKEAYMKSNVLWSFLREREIEIRCVPDCPLWGVDKKKREIVDI